jgi:CheY-like chemotaxis protein
MNSPPDPDNATASVLLADIDPVFEPLLAQWLRDAGLQVLLGAALPPPRRVDLLLVDVPFPRQGASRRLQQLAGTHPGTPVLALSSTLFAGVAPRGDVARHLGVAAVLPMPVTRDGLLAAVRGVLEAAA